MAEAHEVEQVDEPPVAAGLFADVVFDRPLDHAYTCGAGRRAAVAVGSASKPFGRGDRATVGYWASASTATRRTGR